MRALVFALAFVSLTAFGGLAHAEDDGLYDRFDGDMWLSASLYGGARIDAGDQNVDGLGALEMRARYLDSAGFFVTGELVSTRVNLSIGADMRPFFLARFLTGRTFERRFWDLLIDSIGFDLGVRIAVDDPARAAVIFGSGLDFHCYTGEKLRVALRASFRYGHTPGTRVNDAINDWTLYGGVVFESRVTTGAASREPVFHAQ